MTAGRPAAGGALVLGSGYRALGVARSLGRRGVPVWLVPQPDEQVARHSRYVQRTLRWPADPQCRSAWLAELGDRIPGWVLIPSDDDTARLVGTHHEMLGRNFLVASPPLAVFEHGDDKRLTYATAERLGIPHPRTRCPAGPDDLSGEGLRFPVVVKPAVKPVDNEFTRARGWPAATPAELSDVYARARRHLPAGAILVQERIVGDGSQRWSYAALCDRGDVLCSVVARRRRQYPREFGHSSSYVETTDDPGLDASARRFLGHLGLTGLAELEFLRDERSGELCLLDANLRLWTWHALGAAAGVDFPWLLWRLVQGDWLPPVTAAPGVTWMRPMTDLSAAVGEIRSRRLGVREYVGQVRGAAELLPWAADDPRPGLSDAAYTIRRLAGRLHRHEEAAL